MLFLGNNRLVNSALKLTVRLYQITLSPLLTWLGAECRFYPSCSVYACACLDKDQTTAALSKITSRLLKCGPWHPGGVDLP